MTRATRKNRQEKLAAEIKKIIFDTLFPEPGPGMNPDIRETVLQASKELKQDIQVHPGTGPGGDGNPDTCTVIYDGGYLYSVMTREYGWETRETLMQALDDHLSPKGLMVEELNHVAFSVYPS